MDSGTEENEQGGDSNRHSDWGLVPKEHMLLISYIE